MYATKRYPTHYIILVGLGFVFGLYSSQRWFLGIEGTLRESAGLDLDDDPSAALPSARKAISVTPVDPLAYSFDQPPRNELEKILRKIAPTREVMVVISNSGLWWGGGGPLKVWQDCVLKAGVKNYLLVALDKQIAEAYKQQGWNYWFRPTEPPKAQAGTGDNHAYSAAKFGILKDFLDLGWSVLLSDVDVCTIQDPFEGHIYRDSDVEGMTDGFDEATAYGFIDGFDDPSMGWARYAQAFKHFNLNSGLFYLRANERTVELMKRLATRLEREKYWDQTAFNEEIFRLSHGAYKSPQVSVRVMDIYKFQNSKVTFKFWRHFPEHDPRKKRPVLIHSNYHPDKLERIRAVYAKFHDGQDHALDRFPGGSEPNT